MQISQLQVDSNSIDQFEIIDIYRRNIIRLNIDHTNVGLRVKVTKFIAAPALAYGKNNFCHFYSQAFIQLQNC